MTKDGLTYAVQVQGHLDDHWTSWLGEMTITRNEDGTSTLVGLIADQAELHGLLAKVRDLGITLIAVTRTAPSDAGPDRSPTPGEHSPAPGQQSPQPSPHKE